MSLLDISTTDNEDTHKCKACELARKSDTDFMAWKEKLISEGVKGIQEWDSMVNDYADSGKRRPKNPDTLRPPHSLHEGTWGIPAPALHDMNPLGLCHFYPMDPASVSTLAPLKVTCHGGTSPGSPAPRKNAALAIYHHCVPRWPRDCIGAFAGAAYVECTCTYSNLLV